MSDMLEWKDYMDVSSDCVSILKKNGLTVFKIMHGRNSYHTIYNHRAFKNSRLSYFEAALLAEKTYGEDTLENRIKIAKDYFIDDFNKQVRDISCYIG